MIKTENQVYADVISFIKAALLNFEVDGWKVCKLIQPSKFNEIKPVVYVSVLDVSQRGTQFSRTTKKDGLIVSEEVFREEIRIRISALRRNLLSDKEETLCAKDVLKMIASWFVSPYGIAEIQDAGYSIYNPSGIKQDNIEDDSANLSAMPYFDITFVTECSWNAPYKEISGYKLKMKGI